MQGGERQRGGARDLDAAPVRRWPALPTWARAGRPDSRPSRPGRAGQHRAGAPSPGRGSPWLSARPSAAHPSAAAPIAGDRFARDAPGSPARGLVVAPPPVSLGGARRGAVAPGEPPVPATGPQPSVTEPVEHGGDRSALYTAAAALFAAVGESGGSTAPGGFAGSAGSGHASGMPAGLSGLLAHPPSASSLGGVPMSQNLPARQSDAGLVPGVTSSVQVTSRQLDEFVELIVERIEARVVDELERRGRRTGGF
jgi:hypothetical protein